jgi:Holliday junction resolvasome RuvABC ATP-dependent DNA helicase subunit
MNDTNEVRVSLITNDNAIIKNPNAFDGFIGQKSVVTKLGWFRDNYSDKVCFPDMLFTGAPGLGKTEMAKRVAKSLGRELVEISCPTIKTAEDFVMGILIEKVMQLGKPATIFFDEAHALSADIKDLLLTLLNVENQNKKYLSYKGWSVEYDASKINVIFATTDAHLMDKALLNRLEEVYFTTYDNKDLFKMLKYYLPGIKLACDRNDIAYACRGRARDAVKLAKKIRMFCTGHNTNVLDNEGWKQIKDTFGIYAYGLNTKEVEFLKILAKDSPLSSASLASKMGVNVFNIEDEIETRPRELGLIENSCKGRCLTDKGEEYLGKVA